MPAQHSPREEARAMDLSDIAIIGTGFGGIGMAIRLKDAGIGSFVVLSKAADVGGVWHANTYPGAACDVASSLYSFSFEPHWDWSRTYGLQGEIAAYLRHCAEKYGILPQVRFNTEIAAAAFDEKDALWRLIATDGSEFAARILISSCGVFNQPAIPELAGLESFAGPAFHSARWDHGVSLAGKRVAIVGTGCSAAQFVPAIVDEVARLTLFARTPQYILPKPERVFAPEERQRFRRWPILRRLDRIRTYVNFERRFRVQVDERARKAAEAASLAFLEREVKDPDKRLKLRPTYPFGCKRMIASNDYYRALDRDHAAIVTCGIARVVPEGVVAADGTLHAADAIVFGTGVTPTQYLTPMRVTGLGGRDLNEAWRDGAEAYLGMSVAGFPNFFMIYGPNTNTINSIVVMIEAQIGYILKCAKRILRGPARAMTVKAEVQARFNDELRRLIARTAWGSGCRSYFVAASGRVVTQWPKPSRVYRWRTRKVRAHDYSFISLPP
jgi:cation diffusion facilitator CzcD-associated flavoprotein CzcO